MNIKLFDYKLPQSLIAQKQIKPRDHSRLMILDIAKKRVAHKHFYDLPDFLTDNDVLVVNETKVFPARLLGKKATGGRVEVLLTERLGKDKYQAMIGGRNLKIGDTIYFDSSTKLRTGKKLEAKISKNIDGKTKEIVFNKSALSLDKTIDAIGHTPTPPYIKIKDSQKVKSDYQTVYAKSRGSAAAPTAGLHFTKTILNNLEKKGIKIFKVTLHVSLGTFAPVEVEDIKKHQIHHEWATIDKKTADSLNKLKKQGKNIIAVGTTSARTLESFSAKKNQIKAGSKWVSIYIYPGYKWKFVDEMLTNFHLPKSSLLFMISSLAGREFVLKAYKKAVALKYRFFSFGDSMFITRDRL
ncbi:tRNA preQ1(34) S-adenosylmethionine ribosyltransferase-isomerase QueA [Candidatus Parcubacteria bacterium]|nr:MAG: tRNA preQ1(34) S-adenosylmethionine ribosyltransferase-isomerase QueA [Candidatus Parcubacteria bacterium]